VCDATTGRVRTAELPTEHGLAPQGLAWSDSRTLVMDVGQTVSGDGTQLSTSAHAPHLIAWLLEDQRPVRMDVPSEADLGGRLSGGHGFVVSPGAGEEQQWLVWPREAERDRLVTAASRDVVPAVSPSARRLVSVAGNRNPNRLLAGAIPSGARPVVLHPVNDSRQYQRPLAWTDQQHVAVVVRNPVRGAVSVTFRLDLVDVETGAATTLVDERGQGDSWQGLSFATDLLDAPTAEGRPPPDPWNRRGVALGLLIGSVLLGLVGWRLRGRRA
jgi:hypothetical protein